MKERENTHHFRHLKGYSVEKNRLFLETQVELFNCQKEPSKSRSDPKVGRSDSIGSVNPKDPET